MMKFSPLHTKGFFTLSLIVLAENVTFCNAVQFWSHLQQQHQQKPDKAYFNECRQVTNSDTISSTPGSQQCQQQQQQQNQDANTATQPILSPLKIWKRTRIASNRRTATASSTSFAEDCCRDCSHCMMDTTDIYKQCLTTSTTTAAASAVVATPRGGHQHSHSHSHATASAAAEAVAAVTPYNIPLNVWKVIFQAILTAINVFCWWAPLKSKKISENKLALSLANAFSGGVFLSLAFGHLIPECLHGFAAAPGNWQETTPFLLVLAGYLLIFFVEKVAFDAHEIMHEMQGHDHSHSHHHHHHDDQKKVNGAASTNHHDHNQQQQRVGKSAVILLGALAVHSILEMMALGLADTFADSAILTMSIAMHQPAESIALLVAFIKSGMPESQIIQYLSVFSCMGPIGVALGMAVNEYAAPIVDSIMLAIVAGTFVYVGATEVIPEEWEDSTNKWKKFSALMAGIVSIYAITQYTMTLGTH